MAENPQALISMYNMCGQKIQIQREYEDEESKNYGHRVHLDPSKIQLNTTLPGSGLMKVSDDDQRQIEELEKKNLEKLSVIEKALEVKSVHNEKKEPPIYFNVGGIRCKMENGKVYQKQWMMLTEEEMSEFRIVSDKNNKICSMKDKHVEMMKWVLAEDNSESSETREEKEQELING